jgi:hypothetical protein
LDDHLWFRLVRIFHPVVNSLSDNEETTHLSLHRFQLLVALSVLLAEIFTQLLFYDHLLTMLDGQPTMKGRGFLQLCGLHCNDPPGSCDLSVDLSDFQLTFGIPLLQSLGGDV